MLSAEFIAKAPKSDLHVHLDGSIRIPTLIEIAKVEKIRLPSYTVEGLNELLFKENYESLPDYLTCFGYTCQAMQTPENLERVAYEFARDNQDEGVRYVEVRFAPQLHMGPRMDLETVLSSVNRGLETARREFNSRPEVKSAQEPPFNYGIIACAMRMFGAFSDYYRDFFAAHPFSKPERVYALASYELAQGTVKYRDQKGIPVVAFDLAGQEDGYPAHEHWKAYQFANKHFMHRTVHAGEAYGPESIFEAITDLYAERIGHGYYLFADDKINNPEIADPKGYVRALAQYIADKRITIEVCLTSNLQTNPEIGRLENHQFRNMRAARLSTTFCTDNRTVSKTTVTGEIEKAVAAFAISPKELKDHIIYGFKRCFYPGDYREKRAYVRGIIDYYDRLAAEFGLGGKPKPRT